MARHVGCEVDRTACRTALHGAVRRRLARHPERDPLRVERSLWNR